MSKTSMNGLRNILRGLASQKGREGKCTISAKMSDTEKYTLKADGAAFNADADEAAKFFARKGGTAGGKAKIGVADETNALAVSGREAAQLVYVMAGITDAWDDAEALAIKAGAIKSAAAVRAETIEARSRAIFDAFRGHATWAKINDEQFSEMCHVAAELLTDGQIEADSVADALKKLTPTAAPTDRAGVVAEALADVKDGAPVEAAAPETNGAKPNGRGKKAGA